MSSASPQLPVIDTDTLWRVSTGSHHDPHSVLGAHPVAVGSWVIRALRPLAKSVSVELAGGESATLTHLESGIWQGVVASGDKPDYRVAATYSAAGGDSTWRVDDP